MKHPSRSPSGTLYGERCPFPEPSFTHSLEPPPKKKRSPDTTKSHLSLKVPCKGAAPPCSTNRAPLETRFISGAYGLFIRSIISLRVPSEKALPNSWPTSLNSKDLHTSDFWFWIDLLMTLIWNSTSHQITNETKSC
jgi:hypothetical protein